MPTLVIKELIDMLLTYTCVFSHIHLAGKHLVEPNIYRQISASLMRISQACFMQISGS